MSRTKDPRKLPQGIDAQTYAHVAMIVWEYCLEQDSGMCQDYRDCHGVAEMRDAIITLVPTFEFAWRIAHRAGYDTCFDWEFVPAFFEHAITYDCGYFMVRKDWREIALALATEYKTANRSI